MDKLLHTLISLDHAHGAHETNPIEHFTGPEGDNEHEDAKRNSSESRRNS